MYYCQGKLQIGPIEVVGKEFVMKICMSSYRLEPYDLFSIVKLFELDGRHNLIGGDFTLVKDIQIIPEFKKWSELYRHSTFCGGYVPCGSGFPLKFCILRAEILAKNNAENAFFFFKLIEKADWPEK